jgi:hypothetical protein
VLEVNMSDKAWEYTSIRLPFERTLSVVEQALRRCGAVVFERESTQTVGQITVGQLKATGLSPGYDISVRVEGFYKQSRVVMVGGHTGTTAFAHHSNAASLNSLCWQPAATLPQLEERQRPMLSRPSD